MKSRVASFPSNPHYAVVCNLDPPTLGLAALFSRRSLFSWHPGTQTASFAGLIPAITAECGLPGHAANAEAGARLIDAALNLGELLDSAREGAAFDLYDTLRVAEDYFETRGGKLRLRKQVVPAMFTVEPGIVTQDCLCYLMEQL